MYMWDGNNTRSSQSPHKSGDNSFSATKLNCQKEKELDEKVIAEFQSMKQGTLKCIICGNIVEEVLAIGESGNYDLIIVGKGRFPSTMMAELADRQEEFAELGPVGDILASSSSSSSSSSTGHKIRSSVLVIQQHDAALMEEAPEYTVKVHDEKNAENSSSKGEISIAIIDHVV